MKLGHISANSSSIEKATRFYRDILDLKEIKSYELNKSLSESIFSIPCACQVILFANSSFSVEVFIPDDFPQIRSGFLHNCIEVDSLDDFLNRCSEAGLNINYVSKGEKTLVFLNDFDDNLFEVKDAVRG